MSLTSIERKLIFLSLFTFRVSTGFGRATGLTPVPYFFLYYFEKHRAKTH